MPVSTRRLTVLLVDDHDAFRSAARGELESGGLEVVAELDHGKPAVAAAARLQPDAVLLDIRLPDGSGVELAEPIREAAPATAVVLISGMNDDDALELVAGARAPAEFLPKSALSADAVRQIVDG